MGKSAPKPPPAPDYAAAATAQGAANLTAANQGAVLSNPNIVSPYGNQTVSWGKSDPNLPGGGQQATVTQTLTPAAQAALDAQQQVQLSESNLANQGINKAAGLLSQGFQYNGPALQTKMGEAGGINYGPKADEYGLAGGLEGDKYGMAQGQADLSNVAKMPVNGGTTAQQAILQRLNPQVEQTRAATQQRLANQGIPVGSEAWNNEMRQQGQDFNDLYSQAALKGIDVDMAANEQGFNQAQQNAGLYNSALAQNFGQGLAGQQLTNSAIGQNFGQGATATGLFNQAQNQQFNQNLQQFGAENAAQQADWQQQLAQYNQPLNQVTALMSGSQIQNPQFQAYTGQNVNAAPVFQGVQAQGQYAQDTYGQQMAARNAQMQALGSALGAGASFIPGYGKSDLRLKSNIVRIGAHPWGVGIYEYDIEGRRERGVIAQEVMAVRPQAVALHPDGYLMVDYGQVMAA
jgi:hypothetical protein